jgi:cytochrome P450
MPRAKPRQIWTRRIRPSSTPSSDRLIELDGGREAEAQEHRRAHPFSIDGDDGSVCDRASASESELAVIEFEIPDRYEQYEVLRAEGSVVWSEDDRAWLILGFDECDLVLRDEARFAHFNRRDLLSDAQWADVVASVGGEHALALLDEDRHAALHREIRQRLAGNLTRYTEDRVLPVIDRLLTPFLEAGGGDFIKEFSDPLPAAVMASVLGLPWDEPGMLLQWKAWDHATLQTRSRFDISAETYAAARRAAEELHDVLLPVVQARRLRREDDFISQLWECVPEIIEGADDEDVLVQCRQLFQGGSQTTTHAMNNAAAFLFGRPTIWERLKRRRQDVERFVEEVIRVMGVFQLRPRVAMMDTEIGGREIRAGDHLYVMLPAASRDPSRFSCPFALDLDGTQRRRHLSFGSGPRICGGMALARAEIRAMVHALLDRVGKARLDPENAQPEFQGAVSTDWRPLNVVLEPALAATGA